MDDMQKEVRQNTEMNLVLSRIEHVLEHCTQDNHVVAAAVFELFIEIVTEMDDKEFVLAVQKISEIRKKRMKLQQRSE